MWTVQTGTRWVSNDFSPALGFVSRRGIRQSELEVGFRPRAPEGSVVRRYVLAHQPLVRDMATGLKDHLDPVLEGDLDDFILPRILGLA